MKQFILTCEPDRSGRVRLEGGDYHYLVKVRRLSPGEYFPALLPNGDKVSVRVCSVDNKTLTGEISSDHSLCERSLENKSTIILFQALPKGEKMDLIVRQAAEGGVAGIVPFVSEFSAIKIAKIGSQKFTRWERIIKEARQQSGSKVATAIRQPLSFEGLLTYWEQIKTHALGLLFHPVPVPLAAPSPLAQASLHCYLNSSPDVVVLTIGPEGGFSSAEVQRFVAAGFKPFIFEGAVLRTETAALYAQAAVRMLLLEKDSWEMR